MPCACRQPQTLLSRPPPLFAQCCLPLGVFPWKRVLPGWCKGNLLLGGKTSNPVQRVGAEQRGSCATCSSFGERITNVAMVSSREHFSFKLRAADASPAELPRRHARRLSPYGSGSAQFRTASALQRRAPRCRRPAHSRAARAARTAQQKGSPKLRRPAGCLLFPRQPQVPLQPLGRSQPQKLLPKPFPFVHPGTYER